MTAAERQWDADWNNPAFAAHRRYFRGSGRPAGTPRQRYDHLCPMYQAKGIARPLKYIDDNIQQARFFHRSTPAHRDLKSALAVAEADLKAKGHADAPFRKAWAFTARTTSAGSWSNHADGRAIDIDPGENPHLTNAGHRRIISLLSGYDIEAANPGAATGQDSYDAAASASWRFQLAYDAEGLRRHIEIQENANVARQAHLDGLIAQRRTVRRGSRARRRLEREIKAARRAMRAPDLLRRELRRYEAIDQRVTDATGVVEQLEASLLMLEAAIQTTNDRSELRSLRRLVASGKRKLRRAKKRLANAEKGRDRDKLRRYADAGFLSLDKQLVRSMKAAGFRWGGDWRTSKDFMHFDL